MLYLFPLKFVTSISLLIHLTWIYSYQIQIFNLVSALYSPFVDKYLNNIITGDLRIINNSSLRNIFCKGPKYRDDKSVHLDKDKSCILCGLVDCDDNFCSKHDIHKSMFSSRADKVKKENTTRIDILNSTLHKHKHEDL